MAVAPPLVRSAKDVGYWEDLGNSINAGINDVFGQNDTPQDVEEMEHFDTHIDVEVGFSTNIVE